MEHPGKCAYENHVRSVQNRLVGLFHSDLSDGAKLLILEEFRKPNATLRCVIATVAFGMGIQVEDIDLVFHWGPSKNILAYWQEVERCGRDGRQSEAYLYIHKHDLHAKGLDDSMKDFVEKSLSEASCPRILILEHLFTKGMSMLEINELKARKSCTAECDFCQCPLCRCCNICTQKCNCDNIDTD